MEFNITFAVIVVVTFVAAYYIGWYARGKWEEKKHLVAAFGKDLKKARRKKK
jgi:hypothetical protein